MKSVIDPTAPWTDVTGGNRGPLCPPGQGTCGGCDTCGGKPK